MRLKQQATLPYTSYTFFFSKTHLRGWFKTFAIVMTVTGVAVTGLLLFLSALDMLRNRNQLFSWLLTFQSRDTGIRPPHRVFIIAGHVFTLALLVIMVETTIHWNMITGVNSLRSTGQLIPLIISLFGLLEVALGAIVSKAGIESSSRGRRTNRDGA